LIDEVRSSVAWFALAAEEAGFDWLVTVLTGEL
jgi:hypothetical protein